MFGFCAARLLHTPVHDISFPHVHKFDGPTNYGGGWHEQFAWQALLAGSKCLDVLWHGNGLSERWLRVHAQGESEQALPEASLNAMTEEAVAAFHGDEYYHVTNQRHPYAGYAPGAALHECA